MLLQVAGYPPFSRLNNIPLCIIPPLSYPFIHGWTFTCFPTLAVVNNAATNMGVYISLWDPVFIFCMYTPWSGIAELYGRTFFNFRGSSIEFFKVLGQHITMLVTALVHLERPKASGKLRHSYQACHSEGLEIISKNRKFTAARPLLRKEYIFIIQPQINRKKTS